MGGLGSFLNGAPRAVERFQRASSHYAQRPDKDYAQIDPDAHIALRILTQTGFEKSAAATGSGTSAPSWTRFFETNDIANSTAPTESCRPAASPGVKRGPGGVFRSYSFGMNQQKEWNFGGNRQTGTRGSR